MSQPIYEIPVTPPGSDADGWKPGPPVPLTEHESTPAPLAASPSFESLITPPPVGTPVAGVPLIASLPQPISPTEPARGRPKAHPAR